MPTVKYVGRGIAILPARRSDNASSPSAKRLPAMSAREKLFFVCKVVNFVNAADNWPLTAPRTMLLKKLEGFQFKGETCCDCS